jgi:hypothetical protein
MPMVTNQQMNKALTIVIKLAKDNVMRDEQLEAIKLVEHLQTTMFMHNLTRIKEDIKTEVIKYHNGDNED